MQISNFPFYSPIVLHIIRKIKKENKVDSPLLGQWLLQHCRVLVEQMLIDNIFRCFKWEVAIVLFLWIQPTTSNVLVLFGVQNGKLFIFL